MKETGDPVLNAVTAAIRQVLRDTGRSVEAVEPASLLSADLGLDSLDLAQAVVLLERALGFDPFRGPTPAGGPSVLRTVADLAAAYGGHEPEVGGP